MKRTRWLHVLVISIVAAFGALAIACGGNDDGKKGDNTSFNSPAIGVYYYEAGNGEHEYLLSLNKDKSLALTIGDVVIAGMYDVNASGALKFTVKGTEKLLDVATYADDEVTLTYDGNIYKFLRRVDYTVTYNTGSGSKVESASVRNGKKVTKPDDPTYEGHVFIGWYKDATATTVFKFNTEVVRGDITLYAGWEEKTDQDEYTVKFDLGYGESSLYATKTTVNGKVYVGEMVDPEREGYSFKGWWTKEAEGDEYATRVDFGSYIFKQNETVYALWQGVTEGGKLDAPIVSVDVSNNRLSWESVEGAGSYSVKVIDPDGDVWSQSVQGTSVEYARKFTKAGTYTVEVYAVSQGSADKNSAVTTRKIVNKQLARVSNFGVTGDVLTYGGVENATKYLLYIECGDENHNHNPVDNGNSKVYDFSDCTMTENGIKVVVEAQADGYVSSRSEEYVIDRKLEKVTGFTYDKDAQTISWSAVENATSYAVKVVCDNTAHVVDTEVKSGTSINIGECTFGSVKVTVVAKNTKKYISSDAAQYAVTKDEWAAVTGLAINNTTLSWKSQSQVEKYIVSVAGQTFDVTGKTNIDLADKFNWEVGKVYDMRVRAQLRSGDLTSWSLPYSAAYKTMTELKYGEGTVSWTPVFGIGDADYKVVVNNAAPVSVSANECKVTLTDKTNVIKVYIGGNDVSTAKSITVNAYKLTFDGNGGVGDAAGYYAKGDPITFPTNEQVTRRGYNLVGWYTAAEGNAAGYGNGDVYDLASDYTLYARWDGKVYNIKLNYNIKGDNTDKVVNATVKFGAAFNLALPEITKSPLHGFLTWNTAAAGNGEDLTDEFGASISQWHYTDNNMVVYIKWGEIFEFEKSGEGNNAYYTVRKGPATSQVTTIEIPETYQAEGDTRAYPVKIVGGNAFQSCFNLVKITLPSTIDTIEPTALTSLSKLQDLNIKGGIQGVSRYWSVDGVVFGINPLTERSQIEFFPRGRTGEYTMPEGIEEIPYEGFAGASIEKLTIPYTVTRIAATAFSSATSTLYYSKIKEIVFAEPSNANATVKALNIVGGAFRSMMYLTDITFPSREFRFVDADGNESEDVDFKAAVFYGCNSLERVNVANGNSVYMSIDNMLCKKDANGSDITIIFCPNGYLFTNGHYTTNSRITIIGTHAFSRCTKLESIDIGTSITKIEDGAFSGYTAELDGKDIIVVAAQNLKTITFKGGRGTELKIGRAAFGNVSSFVSGFDFSNKIACEAIQKIVFEDGCNVTEIGNYAFAFSALKNVTFPTSLKKVGYGAFLSNTQLENVIIAGAESGLAITDVFGTAEDNVTRAGLFQQCTALQSVHIPKCVTSLGGSIFLGCKKLNEVTVDPENPALEFINGVLYGKDMTTGKINSIHYVLPGTNLTTYTLPDGITEINGGVFANVGDQIKELTINKFVTYIGQEALANTGIQKVIFLNKENDNDEGADKLTIGSGVFKDCKNLTEVILPKRLTVLSDHMFDGALELQSVTLPVGIKEIGAYAFQKTGIKSITIPNTVETVGYGAFYNCSSLKTVTFAPDGIAELKILDENGDYGIISGGAFAKYTYTFYCCTALETITLPHRIKNIGAGMFQGCSNLKSVNIPASVRVMGINAFYLCSSLSQLKFDNRAADGSDTLTIQDGEGTNTEHTTSTYGVFSGCTSLTKIELPTGLDRIPTYAFYGCSALQTVRIPNSVHNTVGGSWDATAKKAIAPVLAVGNYAFNGCSSLKNIVFDADDPADLTENGRVFTFQDYAFGTHPQLTEITLPARYGGYRTYSSATAFTDSTGLSRSIFKANLQKIFISEESTKYKSDENGIIYSKDGTELVFCPTGKSGKVTIASTVTKIASGTSSSSGAFSTCASINEIEFAAPAQGATALPLVIGSADSTVGVFNGCTGLTSITLPERLTEINNYAFSKCSNLKYVMFAGTPAITKIGARAFEQCTSLVGKNVGSEQNPEYSFVVPKTVEYLGDYAFYFDAALASVTFDGMEFDADGKSVIANDTAGLTEIGANAFEKSGLLSIYLPKSITTMGNSVFANCGKLAKASLPNTVTNLNGVFSNCGKLTSLSLYDTGATSNFVSQNSIVYNTANGKKVLTYYPMSLTDTELTATDLAGTTEIGDNAFAGNRYLQTITIPNTVTKIGENAFRHCMSLKEVIFEADNDTTDKTTLTITAGNTTKSAFWGCYNLEKVSFPKRLTTLGDYTLSNLPKLKEVTFPSECKMTVFSANAFDGSGMDAENGLIVNIPNNVIEFKANVFKNSGFAGTARDAQGDAKLVIPVSVKTYGSAIFQNATNLTTVEFASPASTAGNRTNLATGSTMFDGCTSLSSVTLPSDLIKLNSTTFQNCSSLTEITLPSKLTDIAGNVFNGCTSLEKVNSTVKGEANFPTTLQLIDSSAFLKCNQINKITLPDGLKGIGNSAFAGTAITSIDIPNTVQGTSKTGTQLGYMFHNNKAVGAADRIACESLTTVEFADGNANVVSLAGAAFAYLPNLTKVKLPHGANKFATINNSAFLDSGITEIEIPKSVTTIQHSTFKGCSDLEKVTFEKEDGSCKLLWIGNYTFQNCTSLKEIEIPKSAKLQSSATSYSTNIFDGCTSLTKVVFEKGSVITNIVKTATDNGKQFLGCTALTTVRLPENLSVPGVNLFQGCTSLKNIILPSGVTTIPNYTFDGCSSLEEVKFGDVDKYKPEDFATYQSESAPSSIGNYAFQGAGLKTNEDGTKTALLTIIVPPTVTSVGTEPFNNSGLKSLTIMDGVLAIPNGTFKNCAYLTTVTIPDTVTLIGASAFEGCSGLKQITIPAAVTSIGESAFYKTGITSVSFGKEGETPVLTSIGGYAFRQTSLTSVVIPASVTSIGDNPFAYCQKLTKIEVAEGNTAFAGTAAKDAVYNAAGTALYIYATGKKPGDGDELEIVLDSKVTEVKPYAFFGGYITKLTVGDGVTIGSYAFQGNDLTEVTLGANVTLKDGAFRSNTLLSNVTIGEGATIGYLAFEYCSALEALTIPAKSKVDPRAFNNCAKFDLSKVTVSEDVKFEMWGFTVKISADGTMTHIITGNASNQVSTSFKGNTTITHIEIAEGVKAINDGIFQNCTNLVSVKLPSTLETIGNNAFRSATKLETINFPKGVQTIGYYAFYQCPLTNMEVDLGDSLVSMGSNVFKETGIKSVKFPKTFTFMDKEAFRYCENLTTVLFAEDGANVDMGTTGSTDNRFDGSNNIETFVFPGNQTIIPAYLLDGKAKLKNIVIPETVTTINAYAFRGAGLTEITIPATITSFGSGVFQNCASLSKVTLGTNGILGFATIPSYAFAGAPITEITIPKNVTKVDSNAFRGCTQLAKVVFDGLDDDDYALTNLGEACFYNTALTEFVVPAKVTSTGKNFVAGDKIKKITLSPKTTSVPDMRECTALETLIAPEGVTTLAKEILAGMTSIKRIELPSTLATIHEQPFYGLTAEQEIYFAGLSAPSSGWKYNWRNGCKAKIFWDGVADLENPTTQATANLLAA